MASALSRWASALLPSAARSPSASPRRRRAGDPRASTAFLQGLRDRGYFDLAAEYLERPQAARRPARLEETIDYELGRLMLDEARRPATWSAARSCSTRPACKLDAFTKANPNHPKAPEALVQLARLLVERGHLAMLQADETEDKAEKDAKLAEARSSFDQARTAYEAAESGSRPPSEVSPPSSPRTTPARQSANAVHTALMEAQLQKARRRLRAGPDLSRSAPRSATT